jgi:DNA polymerase III sliding clamp (beta) subunit (PCNA family)
MMKTITLPVAELKPALTGLGKVLPGRSTLAILNNIKIERTHDGWIAITSTDLDRWATVRLEHPAEGPPTKLLLPFDQLSQLVKSCSKDESIEVMSSGDHNLIRFPLGDTLGESKVPFISPDEFPVTPRITCEAIPLSSSLRESILEAMECASEDSTRHVLNGTFIDARDSKANYVVATDGRHLYSANSFTLPLKESVIIPTHKFLEWKEFGTDGEWQMRLGEEHLQLSSRRWRFISKTIAGNYPDWRAPIPNPADAKTVITLDPAKLETLIKLIQRMPCHDDRYHTLGLEWKGGQFMLMGKDKPQEDWLRVPVPDIQGRGPDVTVFLDRNYLIKGLGYGLNTLSLISAVTPIRLHSGGKQLIIMPVRTNDSESVTSPAQPPPTQVATIAACSSQPPPKAEQPTPTTTMQTYPPANGKTHHATNGSSHGSDKSDTKSTLEAALLQVEGIKAGFRETMNQLSKIGDSIRAAMREQKASEKEIHGVRQTLRSLQSVRI